MKLTTLDGLLLFLVSHKGQSGYDIRQLFQATPVGIFSDSPGAIYPALARLEMRGLLDSTADESGRRRRVYERTPQGERALRGWLNGSIEPDVLARRPQDLELRFVIIAEMLGDAEAMVFMQNYARAVEARLQQLEEFYEGPGMQLGRLPRKTFELGLRIDRARLGWCRDLLSQTEGKNHADKKTRGTAA
jgi:DNA-binding PadR family transcriptional regulator